MKSLRRVKFWNPIMITAFSGSLLLFSRAFFSSGPHNDHLVSLNLTRSYDADHFDSTLNLSTVSVKPGVLHKFSLPIWDPAGNIRNGTSVTQIFLESDLLGEESSQQTTSSLTPMARSNVLDWVIYRSFSSRLLSNPRAQLRTSRRDHGDVVDKNIDKIYHSEARRFFDPGYDPLEQEHFFSMEESGDRREGRIFALKIWLDPKEFSRAKIGKVEICQASGGIKCWPDSHTNYGV